MEIFLAGFLCLLLKAVKHVDRTGKLGNIDHPECPESIVNPYFFNTLPYRVHGFPVVRFQPFLNLIDLVSCYSPCRKRKVTKIVEGTASELNGLGSGHVRNIQVLVYCRNDSFPSLLVRAKFSCLPCGLAVTARALQIIGLASLPKLFVPDQAAAKRFIEFFTAQIPNPNARIPTKADG